MRSSSRTLVNAAPLRWWMSRTAAPLGGLHISLSFRGCMRRLLGPEQDMRLTSVARD